MQKTLTPYLVLTLGLALLPMSGAAETLAEGSPIPAFTIEDQFGEAHEVDEDVAAFVFVREMAGGKIVKEALSDDGAKRLSDASGVYVSDVSGMPTLVRWLFAMPRLKQRSYPTLLDIEGDKTRGLPSVAGKATLISLDKLRITRIEHLDSAEELRARLEAMRVVDESETVEKSE